LSASIFFFATAIAPSYLFSQTSDAKVPSRNVAKSEGQKLFESKCAICHGLDASGGQRGPNIGVASAAKSRPNGELSRIVHSGIPQKGMPAFNSLSDQQIRAIVAHLRVLQQKTVIRADNGNPAQGQQLFFGKVGCSACHAVGGSGSFVSTDLSDFGTDHDAEEVRRAILSPQEQGKPPGLTAQATTNTGQTFSGMIRNENNSSLQVQDATGQFYLLMKSDLRSIERLPAPSMPTTFQKELSAMEIDDLVSYIMHEAPSHATQGAKTPKQKETGWE
jgi:cytochrome c oxidase cbb3-type subunit III